jgi:hypothetical protein
MNKLQTVEWLSNAVREAKRSATFCIDGCLPAVDPGLEVDKLGQVQLPLDPKAAKALIARCRVAPFGKGTRTLVNRGVRNTWELDPKKFHLADHWNAAVAGAARLAAEQLDLPADDVEARLYKLLVYEKGGFFLPHRDSEKHDGMVASMIVTLPNPFSGGVLVVRHGSAERRIAFQEAAEGVAPCYAAFYADCEHEVKPVTGGVRLCLAYNLVLNPNRAKRRSAKPQAPADQLAQEINSWAAGQPAEPLVFALEHHYTQRGMSRDLLKGADRRLADLVINAAEKSDCLVHLAQVSRHLSQYADDGSFDRYSRYGRSSSRHAVSADELDIGETYEDDLEATQWTTLDGKTAPWGSLSLDVSAIVCSEPLDHWKPTSEEYEGFTGNAGNTLDRWYHRSAIVVWRRDHHFEVIAKTAFADCVPLFYSMAAKLSKTPKKRLEEARNDCIQFARAIISRWPSRGMDWHFPKREKSVLDEFPDFLLQVRDRDTAALFLSKAAKQDRDFPLRSFIIAACREFGWDAFAPELKRLLAVVKPQFGQDKIAFRDLEWLSAFCLDKSKDARKSALAHELCALAVERFCETPPPRHSRYARGEASAPERSLPLLLQSLAAMGREEDLSRVIGFVQSSPQTFRLDECQVPVLKTLVPWSQKRFGSVPPQLASWLEDVRRQLESATASRPAPPADWRRPATITCKCQFCEKLTAFLDDPASETTRIPAAERSRQHLIDMIGQGQCDVKHSLERKGSPYSLVLTKTAASFDRAVQRYEKDLELLASLPPAS